MEQIDPTLITPEFLGFVAAALLLSFVGGGLWVARPEIIAGLRWVFHRYWTVKRSAPAVADYDNEEEPEEEGEETFFRGGKAETENPGETETPRNAPPPAPAVDVKALRDDGMAYAIGAALAHGLYKDGSRTAAIRAAFGDVTGERYSRIARAVRHHEATIATTLPPAAEPVSTPRPPIPIADGRAGYVERDEPAPPRR